MVITITNRSIKETSIVNIGVKLPSETINALLSLESTIGPKISPITRGEMGYPISLRLR
ncbi:MAG: hypothetical protein K9L24_04750 [Spirochaetia bacterium]|nr:hypothetical protein [Spirochaetia bacterium]